MADDPIPLNYRTPSRQRRWLLRWGAVVLILLLIVSSVAAWLQRSHELKERERQLEQQLESSPEWRLSVSTVKPHASP